MAVLDLQGKMESGKILQLLVSFLVEKPGTPFRVYSVCATHCFLLSIIYALFYPRLICFEKEIN